MDYQQQLITEIETRLKTTMIGSLARFEQSFGHLWEEPGPDQQEYIDLWEYTRNSILNNGNKQIRLALETLSSMLYRSYKTKQTYNFNNKEIGDKYEN
jgi:hypothetical protein